MITKDFKQDIRHYKTQLFAGFSPRECAAIAISVVYIFVVMQYQTKTLQMAEPNYFFFLPCILPLAWGFYKPCGITLEEYIKRNWKYLIAPKTRTYHIDNMYADYVMTDYIDDIADLSQDTDNKKKKKKGKSRKEKRAEEKEYIGYK